MTKGYISPYFENGWYAAARKNDDGLWDLEWGRLYCKTPVWKEKHVTEGLTLEITEVLFTQIARLPVWPRHTRWSDPESPLYYPGLSEPLPPLPDEYLARRRAEGPYYPLEG